MSADGSLWFDTQIDSKGFNKGIKTIDSQASKLQNTIGNLGKTIATVFGVAQIVSFAKSSIQASNELENSLIGLQSIVEGQGRSFQKAKKFVEDYISDGLVPATNAATAYKNLAARGYTDTQIQSVMLALKDSASFGRQAHLTMGEAVQSATEGLKNENSILVDNAGVTKNVAKMWDDYAKSIGTTAGNLTQAQKIQAEVNGIIEETKFQVGDAAKVANTYSGQMLRLDYEFNNLKVAIGNFLKPIVTSFLPIINASIQAVTRFANTLASVSSALLGTENKQASAIATSVKNQKELTNEVKKTTKASDKQMANFDEIQKLTQSSSASGGIGVGNENAGVIQETIELDTSDVEEKLDNIELPSGLLTLIDSIKKGVAEIDLTILKDSFNNLALALEPFKVFIWEGLTWLWENILQPFVKWRIEDEIPSFLNLLGGALNVLTSILDVFKPMGNWLWTNFLKPIANWTGGIIIDVMDGITQSLNDFSNWIDENQKLVETISIVIGSFAAAWGLLNIAVGVWNTIGVVATGVIKAFGAAVAFLISPVGLVVLAIGALIAIVALLIANWDTVKEVASKCWEGIKSVWNSVATWFNDNIVQPIADFFGGLWEGIKTGASVLADFMKKYVIDPIIDLFKGLYNAVVGIVEGIVNGFIGIINSFIKGINGVISVINAIPGVSLPTLNTLPKVEIPRLATGTVVPANYGEFIATLGDNKRETEIVSPLSTIKQALIEALIESGGQNITVKFEESTLGDVVRIMKPYFDRENGRIGGSTRTGGAY